jgi:lactoylglutathione lyase
MKKLILIPIVWLFVFQLNGQSSTSYQFTINHLALSVKEVNRSAEFYSNVLKLQEITNKTKIEGIRWFSLGEGKELHLISTVKENVMINKAVHLALTTPDFEAFILALEKMKVIYSNWPGVLNKVNIRADGIKQVFFQDPDGYWIEVNSVKEK